MKRETYKPILSGLIGAVLLFAVYFTILSLANSAEHAWQQFVVLWPWMSSLVFGFGVQVGIFSYMHGYKKSILNSAGTTTAVAATGGVSVGSMAVCCLHHISDVLPILGLSAAALFLSRYQSFFLELGIVSNVVGITFMLHTMRKNDIFFKGGFADKVMKINMKKLFMFTFLFGVLFLVLRLGFLLWS